MNIAPATIMPPSWEEVKDGLAPSTVEWIWVPEGAISSEVRVVGVTREVVVGVLVMGRVVVLVGAGVAVDLCTVDVGAEGGKIIDNGTVKMIGGVWRGRDVIVGIGLVMRDVVIIWNEEELVVMRGVAEPGGFKLGEDDTLTSVTDTVTTWVTVAVVVVVISTSRTKMIPISWVGIRKNECEGMTKVRGEGKDRFPRQA